MKTTVRWRAEPDRLRSSSEESKMGVLIVDNSSELEAAVEPDYISDSACEVAEVLGSLAARQGENHQREFCL